MRELKGRDSNLIASTAITPLTDAIPCNATDRDSKRIDAVTINPVATSNNSWQHSPVLVLIYLKRR